MTTDHRAEAVERLRACDYQRQEGDFKGARLEVAAAQVHATLARDEEQATRHADLKDANRLLRQRDYGMRTHVSKHIADALTSKDANRWKAARVLAQALDEADVNLDKDIEGKLFAAGYDPKTAFNGPGAAERSDDPWAPKPDITADIPEPVRNILAGLIAEMFLDRDNDKVRTWAGGITYELKNVGADLTDAIEKRIYGLTLGAKPSEPPF